MVKQEAQLSQRGRAMLRVCLSASTYLQRSFLLLVTAGSDSLVHKILLNSVLLSPIISGGGRPNPSRQTPLGHNPPCFLPFVGRLGSGPRLVGRIGSGVRVSVNFQQKYPPSSVLRCPTAAENGVMSKRVVSGRGLTTVSGVTNTSSSSCANNGRRTPS